MTVFIRHLKITLWLFIASLGMTPAVLAHGISEADKQRMIDGNYLKYIELGATHMLSGYDHLLFLFGVIFFLTKFKDVVKFITAFTLGHSITLVFATFMKITANYYLVDAVIALTVIYKGFDNIDGFKKYLNVNSPNLLMLVFGFGLIHGFGLSTRLQQLPLGESGLLLKILSFNVGVEVGQILALTAMLLVLSAWRKSQSFKKFSLISNVTLMILGALLFLMQMHGYYHEAHPHEFGFNKPAHQKSHLDMLVNDSSSSTQEAWQDSITLTIPAGKSIEYKFKLKKGDTLDYHWVSTPHAVYFDFHGDKKKDFKSFEKATQQEYKGQLTIPFDGSYGWYWKNKTDKELKILLQTSGPYEVIGLM